MFVVFLWDHRVAKDLVHVGSRVAECRPAAVAVFPSFFVFLLIVGYGLVARTNGECPVRSLLGLFRSVVAEATHRSHQLDACWHLVSWDAFLSHWKTGFSSGSILAGDRHGHNVELRQLAEMPPRSWTSLAMSWTASGSSSAVGLVYPWELFCLVMSNCRHIFLIIIIVLTKTYLCFSSQHFFFRFAGTAICVIAL